MPQALYVPAAKAGYRVLLLPPRIEPSTPRRICRPIPEPTERAALFAIASRMPCCLPPRGPVLPNSRSLIPLPEPEPEAAGEAYTACRSCARRERISFADSRSTAFS